MKRIISFFLYLTACLSVFVSCEREMEFTPADSNETISVTVHASVSETAPVKTYLDNYGGQDRTVLWGTGEQMLLAVTSAGSTVFTSSEKTDAFNGEPEAAFSFTVSPATSDSYLYQGIYPASAVVGSDNTNPESYKIALPSVQNATAGNYDPAAYVMIAQPHTFYAKETSWTAAFRRAAALNCITLKGIPAGKSVKRVEIIAPEGTAISGVRRMNLSTGESGSVSEGSRTIDVKYESPLSGGADMDVWFASWPAEIGVGTLLTITAYTTDSYGYTKEITIPAGHPISLMEGYLNTFSVNVSGISPVLYAFSGGHGTEDSPWRIETAADLADLAAKVNGAEGTFGTDYYRQTADIDFDGNSMQAIGYSNDNSNQYAFKGSYEGAGFKVQNAKIVNSASGKAVGFFGYLAESAHINGLYLENPSVVASINNVGSVVGCIQGSSLVLVENCTVTGGNVHITTYHVGGIAGRQMSGTIKNCSFSGTVWAENNKAGGIVGNMSGGSILNCKVTGAQTKVVANNDYAGGIVGYGDSGEKIIEKCVVDCKEVIGSKGFVAGIMGRWHAGAGRINLCTVSCDVTNNSTADAGYGNIGGIVGYFTNSGASVIIANCSYVGGSICNYNGTSGSVGGVVGGMQSSTNGQKYIVNCCALPKMLLTGYYGAGSSRNIAGIGGWVKYITICNSYCPVPRTSVIYDGDAIALGKETGSIFGWFSAAGSVQDVYWLDTFQLGKGNVTNNGSQSLTASQMRNSGSVTRPSSGTSYSSFVAALNAGAQAWNEDPAGGVTAVEWVLNADGYPVPQGTGTPSAAPEPPSGPNLLNLCNSKIAGYGYSASSATDHVFVVAHRGNTYWSVTNEWPENSLPAIEKAIEVGADMIELDVRLTSDGVPVLLHNEGLKYTTDGSGLVTDRTLSYVKERKMKARGSSTYQTWHGDYVRVPTLAEALAFIKGKNIYVDLDIQANGSDEYPDVSTIIEAIAATGTRDQVMIYSGGDKNAKREYIRQGNDVLGGPLAINPWINSLAEIQSWVSGFWGCAKIFQYSYELYLPDNEKYIENIGGLSHSRGALTFSNALNVDGGSAYGDTLVSWYTGDKDAACDILDKFIASGSDFVQTDYPEIAIDYMTRKGLR